MQLVTDLKEKTEKITTIARDINTLLQTTSRPFHKNIKEMNDTTICLIYVYKRFIQKCKSYAQNVQY